MPPVLVAFFLLLGGTLAPPVVKGLSTPRPKLGKPAPVEYRTWTSSPRRDAKGDCTFVVFALATREKLTRLRVTGEEQLLDWSWSWEAKVPSGFRGGGMIVEFIDPVSREVVARREVAETCWTLTRNQGGGR